jgi:predicted dehydrogenase
VACKLIAAGRHLLCQKPLSNVFVEAVEIVEAAEDAGVLLAVNQQFRWSPAIKASKTLIGKGWFGQPTEVSIQEAMRYLFGDPEWVTSRHARYPDEDRVAGETIGVLDYPDGR